MNTENAPQVEMVSDEMVGDAIDAFNAEAVTGEEFLLSKRAGIRMKAALQAALNARAGGDGELVQLLVELREYMHDRADADHDGEKFVGNVEMGLGERIAAALASQAVGVNGE